MSTTEAAFNTDKIGEWSEPLEFDIEKERIQAYAAATNDPIAQHVAGEFAPPVFSIVPAFQVAGMAMMSVVPGEYLMRVVHGEQDFRFHAPLLPGTKVTSRARAIGLRQRSSGVTCTVLAETRDAASDELLTEQYLVSFFRGVEGAPDVGEAPPDHSFDDALRDSEPQAEVVQTYDADQTYRYAEASGDPMPIHTDENIAKAAGLPGIIIHGLCTMAFTSVAVIENNCADDPQRLDRLAVRFAKIALPEQTITTRLWRPKGSGTVSFETSNEEGDLVIKDGLAEISG
jgi:acyl dehydratase